MEQIYNQSKSRFISLHGQDKFEKLYLKVANSRALTSLTGQSVNRSLAPNPADFLGSANTIPYVVSRFNIGASVMAALIELKIWSENTNKYHHMVNDSRLAEIAYKITARWI